MVESIVPAAQPQQISYGAPVVETIVPAAQPQQISYGAPQVSYPMPTTISYGAPVVTTNPTSIIAPTIPASSYAVNPAPVYELSPTSTSQPKYNTADPVLNRDEQRLDDMANTVANTTGMEHQIEELVEFQREFKREIEQIKAEINHNFATLEDLKRVAQYARTHHMSKMEAAAALAQQQSTQKSKPGPPANLGVPVQIGDMKFDHKKHVETVTKHVGNAFNTVHGAFKSGMGGAK